MAASESGDLPQRYGNWVAFRLLSDSTGQGLVYLAYDDKSPGLIPPRPEELIGRIAALAAPINPPDPRHREKTVAGLLALLAPNALRFGALKVVKPPEEARDPKHALDRFAIEVEAYRSLAHPNLLKLLDADLEKAWLVTEYHPNGTLEESRGRYLHQPLAALRAFRGLVEGLAKMHATRVGEGKQRLVHRDIKPENIFLASDDRLVLGDMGLVYTNQAGKPRVTSFATKIGTLSFLPPWQLPVQREDPEPQQDVYALGKVLWEMISGDQDLPLVYEKGSIEAKCDDKRSAALADRIVSQCVAGQKQNCLPDAEALLFEIDSALKETDARLSSTDLDMWSHMLHRPGPIYLLSVEGSATKGNPKVLCTPELATEVNHPVWRERAARGWIVHEEVWREFLKWSEEHARYLIYTPPGTSRNDHLDWMLPAPVAIRHVKYFQLSIAVRPEAHCSAYLCFGSKQRWLRYDPSLTVPTKHGKGDSEWGIPARRLQCTGSVETVIWNIHDDLLQTWSNDDVKPETFVGLRFRGEFELLFARVM